MVGFGKASIRLSTVGAMMGMAALQGLTISDDVNREGFDKP
jgi:hypothetical protein